MVKDLVTDIEQLSKNSDVKRKNPINRVSKTNDNYGYIEKELSLHFGTKVKVSGKKIEIIFSDNNDLDRLLDIMNIKIN